MPLCAACCKGADAAINLVGVLHSKRGTPYGPQFKHAHVELPRRIVAACAAAGVPRYLHMSALGADRRRPLDVPALEGRRRSGGARRRVVAATIFRPSVVFGPEDNFLNMFARMQNCCRSCRWPAPTPSSSRSTWATSPKPSSTR